MAAQPRPRDWPDDLPVPESWLQVLPDGAVDAHGVQFLSSIVTCSLSFTKQLSEAERVAIEDWIDRAYGSRR